MDKLLALIKQEQLPHDYLYSIQTHIVQISEWIIQQKDDKPLVIGINGAQGTGKSTLVKVLQTLLVSKGYRTEKISLDDLYLSRDEREKRAASLHPLFKTRGVPGTHDVSLGIKTIRSLIEGQGDVLLPSFDKQQDNPKPIEDWQVCAVPVDILLFEGWCVCAPAQHGDALLRPINQLEAEEDPDASWRTQVNERLKGEYQQLFSWIDKLIFLRSPSTEAILSWRKEQESKTFQTDNKRMINAQQFNHFMAHFERLTQVSLNTMPQLADVVLNLDEGHGITNIHYN